MECPAELFRTLLLHGTTLLAAASGGGISRSVNDGKSWTATGGTVPWINSFAVFGSNIYAGGGGVYLSTNDGASWTRTDTGMGLTESVQSLVVHGTYLFAGTETTVFRSSDNGKSWIRVDSGLTGLKFVHRFTSTGDCLFLSSSSGVFRTSNNGQSWESINSGLASPFVPGLTQYTFSSGPAHIFAAASGLVYQSTNNGDTWLGVYEGSTDTSLFRIAVSEPYMYATSFYGSLWRRSLSEFVTSVESAAHIIPAVFELQQNYPNPFNPTTTIKYDLPIDCHVRIEVFDILGREVVCLVDDIIPAGYHETIFNSNNLASGLYLYRIEAGSFIQVRKMLLLK
jgi:hypothetical protein